MSGLTCTTWKSTPNTATCLHAIDSYHTAVQCFMLGLVATEAQCERNIHMTMDGRISSLCIFLIKEQLWLTCHSWGLTAGWNLDASATCMLAEC